MTQLTPSESNYFFEQGFLDGKDGSQDKDAWVKIFLIRDAVTNLKAKETYKAGKLFAEAIRKGEKVIFNDKEVEFKFI